MNSARLFFENRIGILASMHRKEEVIAPILEEELGIKILVPEGFDTDQFGTFTRDIERMGNQLQAARHKAKRAMALTKETLAFASEGSFGPHPEIPVVPVNREILLLLDRGNDLEIIGTAITTQTNFADRVVCSFEEAYDFAISAGFPKHAMAIRVSKFSRNQEEIIKGISSEEDLQEAVSLALSKSDNGRISIETDMRALYNPTRMKNIEAATRNLVKNVSSLCPNCSMPGFTLTMVKKGLPCDWCGTPTDLPLSTQYSCKKCGYYEDRPYPTGDKTADPKWCSYCNP